MLLALLAGATASAAERWRDETVSLSLPGRPPLLARLHVPSDTPGPHAAIMIFGGFRHAARVPDLIRTDEALIIASFDYPFDPPRRFEFPGSLRHAPELKRAIHETVEGIGRLHEHLRGRADVDARRITVVGASAGAPFATVAAARYDVPGLVVVHGFGQMTRVIAHQFDRSFERSCGVWCRPFAWLLAWIAVAYTAPPEPEDYAAELGPGQSALMVSASDDRFIPAQASDTLWTALSRSGATRERIVMSGDHVNPKSEAMIAEILGISLDWMRRQGLL